MDQKETFDWMRSELDRLRADNDRLEAQLARYRAPVSGKGAEMVRNYYIDGCDGSEPRDNNEAIRDMKKAVGALMAERGKVIK